MPFYRVTTYSMIIGLRVCCILQILNRSSILYKTQPPPKRQVTPPAHLHCVRSEDGGGARGGRPAAGAKRQRGQPQVNKVKIGLLKGLSM